MIGTYAIYGNELFFSETLPNNNLTPVEYPLENWYQKQNDSVFIPLTSAAISASQFHDHELGNILPSNHNFPRTCGLTVDQYRTVLEIAVHNEKLVWRSIPWGPGTIYVRSIYQDFEKAIYGAIKLTGDLRKAIELVDANSSVTSTGHIFTNISIVAYAAYKKDLGLIRTMTRQDMIKIVDEELMKQYQKEKEDE